MRPEQAYGPGSFHSHELIRMCVQKQWTKHLFGSKIFGLSRSMLHNGFRETYLLWLVLRQDVGLSLWMGLDLVQDLVYNMLQSACLNGY